MNARRAMLWQFTLKTGQLAAAKRMLEAECRRAAVDVAEISFIRLRLLRPQKGRP